MLPEDRFEEAGKAIKDLLKKFNADQDVIRREKPEAGEILSYPCGCVYDGQYFRRSDKCRMDPCSHVLNGVAYMDKREPAQIVKFDCGCYWEGKVFRRKYGCSLKGWDH